MSSARQCIGQILLSPANRVARAGICLWSGCSPAFLLPTQKEEREAGKKSKYNYRDNDTNRYFGAGGKTVGF
ncbi:hypothetical protein IFR05_010187 [Cadophora sp. M221]|nr:hypothetical protein IFR05_010187 [Cadophora sp. M221]